MDFDEQYRLAMTRRHFFSLGSTGIGTAALASLLNPSLFAAMDANQKTGGLPGLPHFPPKAKRVIFLHQSGGPAQMDLFDYKPKTVEYRGQDLPASVRKGQRITGMTSGQSRLPVAPSIFKFQQYGQSGAWLSELLPYTAKMVEDIAIIKTMNTDAINHDPAITFIQSGSQQPGRPSMGAWVSYGLGSENQNLPSFVVMISQASGLNIDQPLFSRLWGHRISAVEISRREISRGQRSGAVSLGPSGNRQGHAAAHAGFACQAKRHARASVWRPGDRYPHRAV